MTAPDTRDRLRLWLRLLKLTRRIEGELRENLRTEFASTLPRFDVMSALDRFPDGLRMSEISGLLRVSNGNITVIVDRLEEDGLVRRVPKPGDRRASLVRLTDRGRREFATQAAAHAGWIDALLQRIDPAAARDLAAEIDALMPAEKERA